MIQFEKYDEFHISHNICYKAHLSHFTNSIPNVLNE